MFNIFTPLPDNDPLEALRYSITSMLELFDITNQTELTALNNIVDMELGDHVGKQTFFGFHGSEMKPMPWFFHGLIKQTPELTQENQKKVSQMLAHYSAAALALEAATENPAKQLAESLVRIARHFYHAAKIEGEMGSRFFVELKKARTKQQQEANKQRIDRQRDTKAKKLLKDLIEGRTEKAPALTEEFYEQVAEVSNREFDTVLGWIRDIRNGKIKT